MSRLAPHASHLSETKVSFPHFGHDVVNNLPQPAHNTSPLDISFKQEGQLNTNGLRLPHFGQKREFDSIRVSQWIHDCL